MSKTSTRARIDSPDTGESTKLAQPKGRETVNVKGKCGVIAIFKEDLHAYKLRGYKVVQ